MTASAARITRSILFVAALAVALARVTHAQATAEAGRRVRVLIDEGEMLRSETGMLLAADSAAWRIATATDVVTIERAETRRLDVSLGRRTEGQGLGRGLARGALIGGGLGLVALVAGCAGGGWTPSGDPTTCDYAKVGAGALTLSGALVGGLIGLAFPGERWAPAGSPGAVAVTPIVGERIGLAFSASF